MCSPGKHESEAVSKRQSKQMFVKKKKVIIIKVQTIYKLDIKMAFTYQVFL